MRSKVNYLKKSFLKFIKNIASLFGERMHSPVNYIQLLSKHKSIDGMLKDVKSFLKYLEYLNLVRCADVQA